MTAIHFVDFEISREKGDFLKTTIGHLGVNGGSIKFSADKFQNSCKSHFISIRSFRQIFSKFTSSTDILDCHGNKYYEKMKCLLDDVDESSSFGTSHCCLLYSSG